MRIEFNHCATSATVSDRLKGDEEFDYVFGAEAGQTVTLAIASKPKGRYASFYLKGDGFDFASAQDRNYGLTFTAPQNGDYLVTVRNQPAGRAKAAVFMLTLAIR